VHFDYLHGGEPFEHAARRQPRRQGVEPPRAFRRASPIYGRSASDRVYFMRLGGNKLMMKSTGVIISMTGATTVVKIEFVKAE
jgi:hypothetical protein